MSKLFLLIAIPLALLFYFFPQIDLYVSGLFYQEGFYLKNSPLVKFIYDVTHPLLLLYFLVPFVLLVLSLLLKKSFFLSKKAAIFLMLTILLGPGLVINLILKDNVDRARPHHIIQFGGDKQFTPAFVVSDQCEKNCSFVCGHASAGFSLMAIAFLVRRELKNRILLIASTIGFVIGAVRIIQGGHFFSDVIFSFFFTFFTLRILYYLMYERVKTKD